MMNCAWSRIAHSGKCLPLDSRKTRPALSPWFYVGQHDVFPEQFVNFLGLSKPLRDIFLTYHKDLLTADYWQSLKMRHNADQLLEVIPYADRSLIHA